VATVAEWLIDELDDELAKRRRELIDLRLLVATASGPRQETLARACVSMAYAHWEGFSKQALRLYLDHLGKLRIKLGDLKYELQALALLAKLKSMGGPEKSITNAATLLKDLDSRNSEIFFVDSKEIMRIGNMTSENLRLVLEFAALTYLPYYATRANFIDSVICARRHLIAHGEILPVSVGDARDIILDVLTLCDEINAQVQTAALYREYLVP
jgi:hypothetical protein